MRYRAGVCIGSLALLAGLVGCSSNASSTSEAAAAPSATPTASGDERGYHFECDDYETNSTRILRDVEDVWAFQENQGGADCVAHGDKAGGSITLPDQEWNAVQSYYKWSKEFYGTESESAALFQLLNDCVGSPTSSPPQELKAIFVMCPGIPDRKDLELEAAGLYIRDDGNYDVGPDIKSGTWRSEKKLGDCYWERLTNSGKTIANDFVSYTRTGVVVHIAASDGAFSTEGCGEWRRIS